MRFMRSSSRRWSAPSNGPRPRRPPRLDPSSATSICIASGATGRRLRRRAAESPFPDRCAILLDPAMMEQARRAGAGFEVDATHAAARMLGQLGRGAVRATRRSPRKTTKAKTKTQRPSGRRENKEETIPVARQRLSTARKASKARGPNSLNAHVSATIETIAYKPPPERALFGWTKVQLPSRGTAFERAFVCTR